MTKHNLRQLMLTFAEQNHKPLKPNVLVISGWEIRPVSIESICR